jgi:hypothetical protein
MPGIEKRIARFPQAGCTLVEDGSYLFETIHVKSVRLVNEY